MLYWSKICFNKSQRGLCLFSNLVTFCFGIWDRVKAKWQKNWVVFGIIPLAHGLLIFSSSISAQLCRSQTSRAICRGRSRHWCIPMPHALSIYYSLYWWYYVLIASEKRFYQRPPDSHMRCLEIDFLHENFLIYFVVSTLISQILVSREKDVLRNVNFQIKVFVNWFSSETERLKHFLQRSKYLKMK